MDSTQQAAGEARVRRFLIEPLIRRGLAKPASLAKAQFDDMVKDLCARLAYMTEPNLAALEEQAAGNPGGKDRDRFPIANQILDWAGQIQPPGDEASPLVRAVFAAQLGSAAIVGGWSPELLWELKKTRRWPTAFVVTRIRDGANDAIAQMTRLEHRLARGDDLTISEARWRDGRLAVIRKCEEIAAIATQQETQA